MLVCCTHMVQHYAPSPENSQQFVLPFVFEYKWHETTGKWRYLLLKRIRFMQSISNEMTHRGGRPLREYKILLRHVSFSKEPR